MFNKGTATVLMLTVLCLVSSGVAERLRRTGNPDKFLIHPLPPRNSLGYYCASEGEKCPTDGNKPWGSFGTWPVTEKGNYCCGGFCHNTGICGYDPVPTPPPNMPAKATFKAMDKSWSPHGPHRLVETEKLSKADLFNDGQASSPANEEVFKKFTEENEARNEAARALKELAAIRDENEKKSFIQKRLVDGWNFAWGGTKRVGAGALGLVKKIDPNLLWALIEAAANGDISQTGQNFAENKAMSQAMGGSKRKVDKNKPREYKSTHYVVKFRVPYSLKPGQTFPVRGPLLDEKGNRQWHEVSIGDNCHWKNPGLTAVWAGRICEHPFVVEDEKERKLNEMKDGWLAGTHVRKDCGKKFCVHMKAKLLEKNQK